MDKRNTFLSACNPPSLFVEIKEICSALQSQRHCHSESGCTMPHRPLVKSCLLLFSSSSQNGLHSVWHSYKAQSAYINTSILAPQRWHPPGLIIALVSRGRGIRHLTRRAPILSSCIGLFTPWDAETPFNKQSNQTPRRRHSVAPNTQVTL